MDFFCFLLTVLVPTAISQEPNDIPEKSTSFIPRTKYPDPQYESDFSFTPARSASLSPDNGKLPAETEDIPSDYFDVTEEPIQLDPTGTMSTEMKCLYQDDEDFAITTGQVERDATPSVQVETNRTSANDTTTQKYYTPLSAIITLLKLATVVLIIIGVALFLTVIVIVWNHFIFLSMKFKMTKKINSENSKNTEEVRIICEDTCTF